MRTAAFALLAGVLVLGCGGSSSSDSSGDDAAIRALAQSRVARLGYAVRLYAGDHDDTLPRAENWADALIPYLQAEGGVTEDDFRSPAVAAPGFGFAFNAAAIGRPVSGLSDDTVTVFDSTVLSRNAVADLATAPNPPRYTDGNVTTLAAQENPNPPNTKTLQASLSRVKQSGLAMIIYSGDYDDVFPPPKVGWTG